MVSFSGTHDDSTTSPITYAISTLPRSDPVRPTQCAPQTMHSCVLCIGLYAKLSIATKGDLRDARRKTLKTRPLNHRSNVNVPHRYEARRSHNRLHLPIEMKGVLCPSGRTPCPSRYPCGCTAVNLRRLVSIQNSSLPEHRKVVALGSGILWHLAMASADPSSLTYHPDASEFEMIYFDSLNLATCHLPVLSSSRNPVVISVEHRYEIGRSA